MNLNNLIELKVGAELAGEALKNYSLGTEEAFRDIEQIRALKDQFILGNRLLEMGLEKIQNVISHLESERPQEIDKRHDQSASRGLVSGTHMSYDRQKILFKALVEAGEQGMLQKEMELKTGSQQAHVSTVMREAEKLGLVTRKTGTNKSKTCFATELLKTIYQESAITNERTGG